MLPLRLSEEGAEFILKDLGIEPAQGLKKILRRARLEPRRKVLLEPEDLTELSATVIDRDRLSAGQKKQIPGVSIRVLNQKVERPKIGVVK